VLTCERPPSVHAMNLTRDDRHALEQLRNLFLSAVPVEAPYWANERLLELYHATFAQRIAWKWSAVLEELRQLEWMLPEGVVVDFGCGSGIAASTVLDAFGTESVRELVLIDHSECALSFATRQLKGAYPSLNVRATTEWDIPPSSTVLISHMLTELSASALEQLAIVLRRARAIIVVEPGTRYASTRVVMLREKLRGDFSIVAPCPHQQACGMLQPSSARHWCHFHAKPPSEAFTERKWARFADAFGIDVGDLSLSFIVLDADWQGNTPAPTRVIGMPDVTPRDCIVTLCTAAGIGERCIRKAGDRAMYRRFRNDPPRWLED